MSNSPDDLLRRFETVRRAFRADELDQLRAAVEAEKNYPKRYQSAREHGHFHETICDEAEWLARPAMWGLQELRPPRGNDFGRDYHSLPTEPIEAITYEHCPLCRELNAHFAVNTDDGHEFIRRMLPTPRGPELPRWKANGCRCDRGEEFARHCDHYERGYMTAGELQFKRLDLLFATRERCIYFAGRHRPQLVVDFNRIFRQYERWLALEVVGPNPFQPVEFDDRWRTATVIGLAERMHETDDYSPMPILADALQDAGCEQPDILDHCRQSLPHRRGCWVVDLARSRG